MNEPPKKQRRVKRQPSEIPRELYANNVGDHGDSLANIPWESPEYPVDRRYGDRVDCDRRVDYRRSLEGHYRGLGC